MKVSVKFVAVAFVLGINGCAGSSQPPPQRIIHVVDWHYVSREEFAADLRSQADSSMGDAELEERYAAFLADVEQVQQEQVRILRSLTRAHRIRQVYKEGVTEENLDRFREAVQAPSVADNADLERRLSNAEDYGEQALLVVTLDELQTTRLKIGAVGRIMMTEPLDVLPLDDPALLNAADPTARGFRFDTAANAAREYDMARRLAAGGPVVVVILGGAHDLREELHSLNPRIDYVRIEPETYRPAADR